MKRPRKPATILRQVERFASYVPRGGLHHASAVCPVACPVCTFRALLRELRKAIGSPGSATPGGSK